MQRVYDILDFTKVLKMEPAPSNQTPTNRAPQHPLNNYQFNADEIRVLQECNSESFFQRSLPIGTGLGLAAFFGVKNGYLKPNINYGPVPKVVCGVIIGYFLGKFSYQQKCIEKMMKLPNSKLAEVLRKRQKGGGMIETITGDSMGMGIALSPFTPTNADIYSDEHLNENSKNSALNLDTDRNPSFSGLDDIYRPSLDNPNYKLEQDLPIEPVKPGTSYEQLRQRNREEYMKKQQNPLSRPLPPEAPTVIRRQMSPQEDMETDTSAGPKKNKYGDTWTG